MIHLPINFKFMDQLWTIRAALPQEIAESLGECRADSFEILINPNQSEESMRHTIWHEITHSWEQKLQLELTERQVDVLSLSMLHFFRTNSDYVELLFDDGDTNA